MTHAPDRWVFVDHGKEYVIECHAVLSDARPPGWYVTSEGKTLRIEDAHKTGDPSTDFLLRNRLIRWFRLNLDHGLRPPGTS